MAKNKPPPPPHPRYKSPILSFHTNPSDNAHGIHYDITSIQQIKSILFGNSWFKNITNSSNNFIFTWVAEKWIICN